MIGVDAARAMPVHPAATVMLLRDSADGVEVFMLRRASSAAFAGGAFVFPGGRVDDADTAAELEPYCAGLDDASASAALGIDRGGLAFWVAAVRECFEEAGVLLGRSRSGAAIDLADGERQAVYAGTLSMIELCQRHDLVLDLAPVLYVAHWVTPRGEARRFDTRFFLAPAPAGQEPVHDEGETVDSRWFAPAEALAAQQAGKVALMPPTIASLQMLSAHSTVADALDAARGSGPPPRIEPRLRLDATSRIIGVAMPGDADYDTLD